MTDSEQHRDGIAIIGAACRFPGAPDVDAFWSNLVEDVESISFFSDADLAASGLDPAALRRRGQYVAARGVLDGADCFDAAFFGVPPAEAEVMDPQHRVFLETCWTALERAGHAADRLAGMVGVFGGATFNTYDRHVLGPRPDLRELVGGDLVMFGNEKDYLTSRVAYKLGLRGPAVSVSTACSSSLVAVCQACHALLAYQCDMALAGGASITVPQKRGYFYDDGNIASSDGHTRTFDERASGTAFSNGVGVVVLKRLEDAIGDGDQIYAVIKGAALNNDGSHRVSFGAPGVEGQSEVIALAHALAGFDPESIGYVEAHGTATPLGDPIEVAGLTRAFRLGTNARQFCGLGSVKSNIGHLDAASGVAGLIKTMLALHHRLIPATLHFTRPNPKLELETSPFYVNATRREWATRPGAPRRAGVSSFGTGGTNAHVVLEEAPELPASGPSRPAQLLVLSAKTNAALEGATDDLAAHLTTLNAGERAGECSRALADAAFTLATGRSTFVHRRIVVCPDPSSGAAALAARDPARVFTHRQKLVKPPIVFMFPGQGAQYAGMGAGLYRSEAVFRAEVDRCAGLLHPLIGVDLRAVMFPAVGLEAEAERLLIQTRLTQPALFVIEHALAKLWMSWGIEPAAMIGHSVGEYVAGCLSGVFSVEDALTLVARRGQLVQAQPGGAMLAVRLPEDEVLPLLDERLAIAAINSPSLSVVAGPHDQIAALEAQLAARDVSARRLQTSHAFHSSMMDPVIAPFTELLEQVPLGTPRIPYVSNVTARWITETDAKTPAYWAGHVREAVRFADGVAELLKDSRRILLEVGPGQTLTTLARQHPAKTADHVVLASLPARERESEGLLETLGRLWTAGAEVNWDGFYANERRRRVVLPTYRFERTRHWPDAPAGLAPAAPSPGSDSQRVRDVEDASTRATAFESHAEAAGNDSSAPLTRQSRILAKVRSLLHHISGLGLEDVDPSMPFLELGLDSLLLTQVATRLRAEFGVAISFRQLMEELSSMNALAERLDTLLPSEMLPSSPPAAHRERPPAARASDNGADGSSLRRNGDTGAATTGSASGSQAFGPYRALEKGTSDALTPRQQAFLDDLVTRYTARTRGSKEVTQRNRARLADPRTVAGFRTLWKELVYPLVTVRSEGTRLWDIDGHEYTDFTCGFGTIFLGHRPPFVTAALEHQVRQGFEIGPQSAIAGEVAELIAELTGMERVAFCNTGSEAVTAALRMARTVTGRDRVVMFAGAYHGIFDEVLMRPVTSGGELRSRPIAPGIPAGMGENIAVLEYAQPAALDYIASEASRIAAVIVEPVQSRKLDLQPREFLRDLRRLTSERGVPLVFDEIVTGFRVHPGGCQAVFGVKADLATYGKVVGGGLPIGVVTGRAEFMDALDGGSWQYGDASGPETGMTFFAGTFMRHPLALAAARAVLTHLKEEGPALQRQINRRTRQLAERLDAEAGSLGIPVRTTHFASLFALHFPSSFSAAGIFHAAMRQRGMYTREGGPCFLTTAHTDQDLDQLVQAFRATLIEMQRAEFFDEPHQLAGRPVPGSVPGRDSAGEPAWFVPDPGRPGKYLEVRAAG